jgi:transcription elongation factor Elf1
MPEFASHIAVNEYDCPHCGQAKTQRCKTPKGRLCAFPHGKRIALLTDAQLNRCKAQVLSWSQLLDYLHTKDTKE